MSHHPDSHLMHLFQSIGVRLVRLALRYGVPSSDCEDCAQESFLALLIAHPDWSIESPRAVAWLCGAARNQAMNFHRRRHYQSPSLDELGCVLLDESTLPSALDADRDGPYGAIAAKAQALLNSLPEINQKIVVQRAQEDRSFSKIAEAVGLTRNQVKARYRRALNSLRRHCRRSCNDASSGGGEGTLLVIQLFAAGLRAYPSATIL